MFDFIRVHQLDLMLLLCGACAVMTILLLFTRFLSGSRKMILILMEVFFCCGLTGVPIYMPGTRAIPDT